MVDTGALQLAAFSVPSCARVPWHVFALRVLFDATPVLCLYQERLLVLGPKDKILLPVHFRSGKIGIIGQGSWNKLQITNSRAGAGGVSFLIFFE